MTPSLLALREMLAKATPAKWRAEDRRIDPDVVYLDDDGACGDPECCGPRSYYIHMSDADAALIVAAVNALPALLDLVDAVQADLDVYTGQRTKAALARFDGDE